MNGFGKEGVLASSRNESEIFSDCRKRTPKQQFVYLMYNDILQYIIKSSSPGDFKEFDQLNHQKDENAESADLNFTKSQEKLIEQNQSNLILNGEEEEMSHIEENHSCHPQMMNITFVNGNTYNGCVEQRMLEGRGEYWWNNGEVYKGHFHQNHMLNRGIIEWNNGCWYEGDFFNGYRHGKGLIINPNNHFMYTGDWHYGRKHGKGYCCDKDNDSYEGDWAMDKMEGVGTRNYPNGERYVGQWKDNLRHGVGMMTWVNGDVYYGEWANGYMHGYGEYIWKSNEDPTQRISYVGNWYQGVRQGEGSLMLGSLHYPQQLPSSDFDNKIESLTLTEINDDEDENQEEEKA